MDRNKLKVLRDLPYVVHPGCGMCLHSTMESGSDWGVCEIWTYQHEKHTGEPRKLSVSRYGSCPSLEFDHGSIAELHAYAEFIADQD